MVNFSEILIEIIKPVWTFLGSYPFLFFAVATSFTVKTFLLIIFGLRGLRESKFSTPLLLLLLVLIGGMIEDSAWLVKLCELLFFPKLDYRIVLIFLRIGWAFVIVRYQALALLIENLSEKKAGLRIHQILFLTISTLIFLFSLAFSFYFCSSNTRPPLEFKMIALISIYTMIPLMLAGLTTTLWKLRSAKIPRIIKRQLKILIRYLVIPVVVSDFIQTYPFNFAPSLITHQLSLVGISTIALTCTIYYSARKVMGLRFLNLYEHVRSPKGFNFMQDFKNVLEQFSHVTNERELIHITQNFFKDAFNVPIRMTRLHIRNLHSNKLQDKNFHQPCTEEALVESFISAYGIQESANTLLKKRKIIITDEMAFSNFYEKDTNRDQLLNFLSNVNADIFIPVYDNETLVAYIIVERYARTQQTHKNSEFYSNVERDQMVVFATYLGNIIHLLQNRNLNSLIAQEKELQEELYDKHQKINQYKESIRSFLRTNKEKKIGIIFYKNRRFTFGNQIAQELVQVNLNAHEGHPITRALKKIARHALEFKSQQACFVQNTEGNKLVLSAIPNLDQNNVIITVYYPEISDLLRKKVELLSDPTKWDYLLYLETTKSGKLIDQLIPGTGEKLLNFKINLLKIALSKKAILLDMAPEDLMPTVELLHHISLRKKLHVLKLKSPSKSIETAVKLFGINPIFGMNKPEEIPLLKKLDGTGTLFIQNIHFLDLETQEYLGDFLRYGIYKTFKSDNKTTSNIRIICSTNKNLQEMVQEGTFSKTLFGELNKTTLAMPSLITLPENELKNLATGFSEQALKKDAFKNLFELTDKEKKRLAHTKPASLQELKTRVQQLLAKKSEQSEVHEETQFDPAYTLSDPELVEAARLGKHALKDRKIMTLLWNKFKNQNKIATLLGVNRSSVSRRMREYRL